MDGREAARTTKIKRRKDLLNGALEERGSYPEEYFGYGSWRRDRKGKKKVAGKFDQKERGEYDLVAWSKNGTKRIIVS